MGDGEVTLALWWTVKEREGLPCLTNREGCRALAGGVVGGISRRGVLERKCGPRLHFVDA